MSREKAWGIRDYLHYFMTDQDMGYCNPDASIIKYDLLTKIFNIDNLFRNTNKIIILYLLQSRSKGHWVTLFRDPSGVYHFFDSYGLPEDTEVDHLTDGQRQEYNERKDRLHILLKGKPTHYNNICYQKPGTATCGMFVTHRLHHADLNEGEYYDLMKDLCHKDQATPDAIVAAYCRKILSP